MKKAFYQRTQELKIDSRKTKKTLLLGKKKYKNDPTTPTIFHHSKAQKSKNHLIITNMHNGNMANDHEDSNNEPPSIVYQRRSFPLNKISRIGRHGSFNTFDLSSPMKKIISRKLSV